MAEFLKGKFPGKFSAFVDLASVGPPCISVAFVCSRGVSHRTPRSVANQRFGLAASRRRSQLVAVAAAARVAT